MESVKLPSVIHFCKSKMATSKTAVSKVAFHVYIASKHHFVSVVTLDQPLYWEATDILDSPRGSHLESFVLMVGGFNTSMNLLLGNWYPNGWHITTFAF